VEFRSPRSLVFAISLSLVQPHDVLGQTPSPSASALIDEVPAELATPDSASDISVSPRIREYLPQATFTHRASSRRVIEISPAQIRQAQVEDPTSLPSPTSTPLSISLPTPLPTPISTPTPAPSISPPVLERTPLFPVPPPQPAPGLVPPPRPPPTLFRAGGPDLNRLARAIPLVEVWRAGVVAPQIVGHHGGRYGSVLVAGSEFVTLRLQFHPFLGGKPLVVRRDRGVNIQPPQGIATISPTGECVLQVQLLPDAGRGQITLYTGGVTTALRLLRVSEAVLLRNDADQGAAQ
jgi:hypothetical protein